MRSCLDCKAPIDGASSKLYCSDRCKWRVKSRRRYAMLDASGKERKRLRERERYQARAAAEGRDVRVVVRDRDPICTAVGCEEPHLARGFCFRHYRQARRAEGATWASVGGDYRRRARRYGVEYEPFEALDIFERDGWVCGICSEAVDPEVAYPDPTSPSLDHIIPMSRGGGHVASNAQCSHLGCNRRKSDRLEAS